MGRGLEGALGDARSAQIIRSAIAPAFREGRYGPGLVSAAEEILAAIAAPGATTAPVERPRPFWPEEPFPWRAFAPFLLLFAAAIGFIVTVAVLIVRRVSSGFGGAGGDGALRDLGSSSGSSASSGSSDSSSSSHNSWSGGGGDFGGGGASGRW